MSSRSPTSPEIDPELEDEGPVPAVVLEHAVICRAFVQRAVGVELDDTPETLPLLDHYLGRVRAELSQRPELEPIVVQAAGCYFGELARIALDGFWRRSGPELIEWEVCGTLAYLRFSPFGIVRDAIHQGKDPHGPSAAYQVANSMRRDLEQRLAAIPPVPEDEFHLLSTRLEVLEIVAGWLRQTAQTEGTEGVRFDEADYPDLDIPLN